MAEDEALLRTAIGEVDARLARLVARQNAELTEAMRVAAVEKEALLRGLIAVGKEAFLRGLIAVQVARPEPAREGASTSGGRGSAGEARPDTTTEDGLGPGQASTRDPPTSIERPTAPEIALGVLRGATGGTPSTIIIKQVVGSGLTQAAGEKAIQRLKKRKLVELGPDGWALTAAGRAQVDTGDRNAGPRHPGTVEATEDSMT